MENSLFVNTFGVDATTIPIGIIADNISNYLKITIHHIDHVISRDKLYYFVHFDQPVPAKYREEIQKFGKQFLFTTRGLLQIGLNTSKGLNSNTTDIISQYRNKNGEWYCKDLESFDKIYKWEDDSKRWNLTNINPFD